MLTNIYKSGDKFEQLWYKLAPEYNDVGKAVLNNSGLTQKKHEIIELWQLFDRLQSDIIVEIGVSQGGTFAGWCQLASTDALIIGIDRDVNDCWPRRGDMVHPDIAGPEFRMTEQGGGMYSLKRKESNQTIIPINGWSYESKTVLKLQEVLNGCRIDFLFHDASHKYEDTVRDFELYWPLIESGGVMAFHDIAYSSVAEVTKWKFWREIIHTGPQEISYTYEYNDRFDQSMGIGVLFKGGEK